MSDQTKYAEALMSEIWKSIHGEEFDEELMGVISFLKDAELFMDQDWEDNERRIEAGELTRKIWSKEAAGQRLQAARDSFWRVRERIVATHGHVRFFEMAASHAARRAEYENSRKPASIEGSVLVGVIDLIVHADGRAPNASRVKTVIDSLKEMNKLKDPNIGTEERKRVKNGESRKVLANIVKLYANRTPYYGEPIKPSQRAMKALENLPDLIHEHGLFHGKEYRVDRKAGSGLLRKGRDSSRDLFGSVKWKKGPSHDIPD